MKTALITGITGQDGSYLAEFLLSEGYIVYGLERRVSIKNRANVAHLGDRVIFISGDLLDQNSLISALKEAEPDEVYNLAAQSFVHESWRQPLYTGDVTGLGAMRMLEAVKMVNPKIKFYQASSSEMFGKVQEVPQKETTPFYPRSPYGIAKLYAHWAAVNYRESYSMFCVSGILFNHESPRRGLEFVTRKITNAVSRIKIGLQNELVLGNLDAKRDWGYAGDYVQAMWRAMQQENADDYVIATGVAHTVGEFVEESFFCAGLDWRKHVRQDKRFMRPAEVELLVGDASKARERLGWRPTVDFKGLVRMMVEADLKRAVGK